jgi:hypothetical protein
MAATPQGESPDKSHVMEKRMKKLGMALLLAALAGVAPSAAAQDPKPDGANQMSHFYGKILKVVTTHQVIKVPESPEGVQITDIKMLMAPMDGGKPVEFHFPGIAGKDSSTGKPIPYQIDDETKKFLQAVKPNKDVCHILFNVQNKVQICQHIEAYQPVPGEDEINVYIFVKKGDVVKDMPTFEASKFKAPFRFILPPAKASGPPAPDPKMVEALDKFKPDDLLEIEAGPNGVVKTLSLWEPPKMADLMAISKNEKGQTVVEVNGVLDSKTLVVPPSKMNMIGKIRPLLSDKVPSKSVLYHAVADPKDPSVLVLKDIRPTPHHYVAPQVASTGPAEAGAGDTAGEGVFWATGKGKLPVAPGQTVDIDFIEIHFLAPDHLHVMLYRYLLTLKDAPTLLPKVAGMKQGTPVTFKYSESLQGRWMSDIKVKSADTQPAATPPAGTQPASKPAEEKKPA